MDKKILGNFIIAFPPAAYITYNWAMHEPNSDFDWTKTILTILIVIVSSAIGTRIKNQGEAE